jgi:hypothetical protein
MNRDPLCPYLEFTEIQMHILQQVTAELAVFVTLLLTLC